MIGDIGEYVVRIAESIGIEVESYNIYLNKDQNRENYTIVLITKTYVSNAKKKKLSRLFKKSKGIHVGIIEKPKDSTAKLGLDFILYTINQFPLEKPTFEDIQLALRDIEELYDKEPFDVDFYLDIHEGLKKLNLKEIAKALNVPEERLKRMVYYFGGFLYENGVEGELEGQAYEELMNNQVEEWGDVD